MGVFNKLFGRLRLTSDPTILLQTSTVIQTDTSNSNIAIVPNGTGALVASIPDSTVTGGNTRGNYSTDFQRDRNLASQVASGYASTIVGGSYNSAGGSFAVVGGYNNRSTGNAATIFGYENVAGTYGTAVGILNTVSDVGLVSGYQNTVTGTRSFGTGYSINVTGGHSIGIGWAVIVNGQSSGAIGNGVVAGADTSFAINASARAYGISSLAANSESETSTLGSSAFGYRGYTALDYQQSLGNSIVYKGDAQTSKVIYNINTGQVSSGGNYTFTGSQLIIPKNSAYGAGVTQSYFCTAKFIYGARAKTGTVTTINNKDCFTAVYNFAAKTTSGLGGALIGTPTLQLSFSDANLAATVVSITLGASGEILFNFTPPTWTGGGTIEFRGTLHLEFTEIGLY